MKNIKVEPALHFFHFLASLREELRARALLDAIVAEKDVDDWSEVEELHRAQRRARRGKRR
jgi:hypothetical protein